MRVWRFLVIIVKALNPLNPRLNLTWVRAWAEANRP